ncbi:Sodium/hydrogen exchanger family-domain-containing protein [Polychytrium aggregatum]|uniref:Sodium/hydrogen exchanger family-domain-containing protein n=1 Tax=Polychytrium aggregatum TaxID=110093 RepID=UPI0022FDFEFD|nr:Sodium/hydrogen exchanger family-domain-containing protein [Polychytrium aggregatum]KAI9190769.1 Sodium/hydrogen exchanger family-domain-containing protein [Polychytrium aggregatum]
MIFFRTGINDVPSTTGLVGAFICLFGFVSLICRDKLFISETLLATLLGIAFGPIGINLVNPFQWDVDINEVTLQFSQVVMAIQVTAVGVVLRRKFWVSNVRPLAVLLGPIMISTWLITAVLLWALAKVNIYQALIIGACTAPTDPVLANSIVSGKFADLYLSIPIRDLLSGESAVNDGLAVTLFSMSVMVSQMSPKDVAFHWTLETVLYEMGVAIIIAILIGLASKWLLRFAHMNRYIDRRSFLCFILGMALFTVGICSMLGLASVFACLVAGVAFSWDGWYDEEGEDHDVSQVIDMVLNMTFFIFVGASIPWSSFHFESVSTATMVGTIVLILILRRLPLVLIGYKLMGLEKISFLEAFFVGWFGPTGVSALWYMAAAKLEFADNSTVVPITSLIVLTSILMHGITVPFAHVGIRTVTKSKPLISAHWPENVNVSATAISGPIPLDITFTPPADESKRIQGSSLSFRPSPRVERKAVTAATLNDIYVVPDGPLYATAISERVGSRDTISVIPPQILLEQPAPTSQPRGESPWSPETLSDMPPIPEAADGPLADSLDEAYTSFHEKAVEIANAEADAPSQDSVPQVAQATVTPGLGPENDAEAPEQSPFEDVVETPLVPQPATEQHATKVAMDTDTAHPDQTVEPVPADDVTASPPAHESIAPLAADDMPVEIVPDPAHIDPETLPPAS